MKIALVAMSGIRCCNEELLRLGLTLPGFVERGRGHLVNVASTAGKGGYAGGATYCGT